MLTAIKRLLAPPVYDDPEQTRKARLLNTLLLTFLAMTLLSLPLFALINRTNSFNALTSLTILAVAMLGLVFLMRRGQLQLAYNLLLVVIFLYLAGNAYFLGVSPSNATGFLVVTVLAALLIGGRAAIVAALVGSVALIGIFFLQSAENPRLLLPDLIALFVIQLAVALLLRLAVNSTGEALQLAHRNEQALAQSNQELEAVRAMLEQRVAERTRDLTVSVEVSRRLSTILDPQQLAREIVEQVQAAFDYYHVHIYLFDERDEKLVMVGGTGEAGQAMLAAGHRLERGRGLVGRAAASQRVVLVSDVNQEPAWLPNPLLPETRSEMAVPIAIGGQVFGVLDIQHNVTNGLQEKDIELVQSLANQVAVALQNARLYTQAQLQAERETLLNNISQRIQRATTIEATLQIAAEELGRTMGASRATVQLANPARLGNGRGQEPA
jgi:putative methionine-R-sulfoxide reductase with GAF domain